MYNDYASPPAEATQEARIAYDAVYVSACSAANAIFDASRAANEAAREVFYTTMAAAYVAAMND